MYLKSVGFFKDCFDVMFRSHLSSIDDKSGGNFQKGSNQVFAEAIISMKVLNFEGFNSLMVQKAKHKHRWFNSFKKPISEGLFKKTTADIDGLVKGGEWQKKVVERFGVSPLRKEDENLKNSLPVIPNRYLAVPEAPRLSGKKNELKLNIGEKSVSKFSKESPEGKTTQILPFEEAV